MQKKTIFPKNKFSYKNIAIGLMIASTINLVSSYDSLADSVPSVYRFVPYDTFMSFDVKISEKSWYALNQNPSFRKLNLFSSLSKSGDFSLIDDPQIKNNLGENLVITVPRLELDDKTANNNVQLTALARPKSNEPFVLAVEMKNSSKNAYIKSKIKKMFSTKKDSNTVESKYRDTEIISIIPKTATTSFKPSYFALQKNIIVYSNDVTAFQDSVKSYYNASSLSDTDNFYNSYFKLGRNYQVQMYMNMKKLSSSIFDDMSNNEQFKALKNQGIFSSDSLLLNLNLEPKSLEIKSYIVADKNSGFYKSIVNSRPGNISIPTFLPKESMAFIGSSDFNFEDYMKSTGASGKVDLKKFKEFTGVDIEDFYSNLKGENGVVAFNTQANHLIPGFAFFFTPKNEEKMIQTLNSMKVDISSINSKISRGRRKQNNSLQKVYMTFSEQKEYDGYKVVMTNSIPDFDNMNIRPAYTIINGKVILASNEEVMRTLIDRIKNKNTDFTLEKNPSFENIKDILGNNHNSLGYVNLDTIVSMLGTFGAGDKSGDMKTAMESLKKIHALGFNSINDKDGVLSRIILIADIDKIDFEKLFSEQKKKLNIDINKNKSNYY